MTGVPLAGRPPARIGRRIAGYAIDQLPVMVAGGVVAAIVLGRVSSASPTRALGEAFVLLMGYSAVGLAYGIGLWWWLATAGLSPGKRLLGLRVVSATTGRPIGWGPALLRSLVLGAVVVLTLGVGAIALAVMAARHPRRRGWHDLAAGSVVIDEHAAVPPPPVLRDPHRHTPGIVSVGLPSGAAGVRPAPAAAPGPAAPSSTSPVAATPGSWTPPAPPTAAPSVPSAPAPPPVQAVPRSTPSGPPPSSGRGPIAAVPGLVDAVPGVGSTPPAAAVEEDDPELTRMPGRGAAGSGGWILLLGGRRLLVHGTGLLGRDPQPRAGEDVAHLVPVEDPQRSLSKTHLAFGVDADGFWVCDRGSTNGTVLRTPDGARQDCPPDTPVRAMAGAVLLVGDHEVTVGRG